MKTLLLFLLLPLTALAARSPIPDIPPDANSAQYQNHLRLMGSFGDDGLGPVQAAGARNLEWLNHINSILPADKKISLTSKETQRGIPITAPSEYNPTLILAEFNRLKSNIPAELRRVIYEGGSFTNQPPVELATYIEWCRLVDRNYQMSSRWRTMQPYISYLEGRRREDLRGIYFLSRLANRAEKLRAYSSLPENERAQIREWLTELCFNDDDASSLAACQREVDAKISGKTDLEAYYQKKEAAGAALYRSYFEIPAYVGHAEYRWENFEQGGGARFITPFQDPGREDARRFLQDNIQDEWRFGDWRLELPFVNSENAPHIEFVPGETPHVNGLGGDTIVMDANQPLTEYDAQWTIRHEYGHVLGLPDCYVEFYVAERKSIMNYQLDIDNIMCSRRGHVMPLHAEELRRTYNH